LQSPHTAIVAKVWLPRHGSLTQQPAGTQEGITFAISQTHYANAFLQPRPKWRNLEDSAQ
jgi:hypothetical protein